MLDKETVQKIAQLSRLQMTEQEISSFQAQLSAILDHFNQITTVDTSGVQPLVTPTEMPITFRPDEARSTATSDEMLMNAPEKTGNLFKVPPVV